VAEDRGGKQLQKMKEMGAKGTRMGVWIRTLRSTPCLSSPASGSPSGAVLCAHTARSVYQALTSGHRFPNSPQTCKIKKETFPCSKNLIRIEYFEQLSQLGRLQILIRIHAINSGKNLI
jgi:hypothetical protein